MAVHLPAFETGSVYTFQPLHGQRTILGQQLKVEGITADGLVVLAVSMGPDQPFVTSVYRVPYLTAKEMVKIGVWTYDEKESRK